MSIASCCSFLGRVIIFGHAWHSYLKEVFTSLMVSELESMFVWDQELVENIRVSELQLMAAWIQALTENV